MKIAYLTNQYPHIAHTFIRREILALERTGFEVVRLAIRSSDLSQINKDDQEEARKTRVLIDMPKLTILKLSLSALCKKPISFTRTLGSAITMGLSSNSLLKHFFYFVEACLLSEIAAYEKFGHVHVHFGTNPATVAHLAKKIGNLTYSLTVHGPEEFDRVEKIHLAEKIRSASFVAAVSSYGRSQLYRWSAKADWDKIHIVRCGININEYAEAPPLSKHSNGADLVCVGRLAEQKGQSTLIRALSELKDGGSVYSLNLVGDGEEREALEQLCRQLGVKDQVNFLGWRSQEEVRELINTANVFVLPSYAEGLPVVLMEAVALSKPCISTFIAGIPELIENGRSGWLTYAGDHLQLSEAIQSAMNTNPRDQRSITDAAMKKLRENHDIEEQAEILAELFRNRLAHDKHLPRV